MLNIKLVFKDFSNFCNKELLKKIFYQFLLLTVNLVPFLLSQN